MSLQLTDHFSVEEFACHDGSPYPVNRVDIEDARGRSWAITRLMPLCLTLEKIRECAGDTPLKITSGYRSLEYDQKLYELSKKSGGGKVAPPSRSQHPKGRAADIVHTKLKALDLFNLVLELYRKDALPFLGGVGLYPRFIHVDVRPRVDNHLAVWGGTRPTNIV